MVMELLGESLEDLFKECNRKFSVKTVCMVGLQILDRFEFIHKKNIIHRDIKADNFVIGLEDKSHIIYVLDFGLSKKYRSGKNKQHIKMSVKKKLTGTARYASINALKGCEQSRRDDLEAISYLLLYFLRGVLPWQGIRVHKHEDRYKKILKKKMETTAEDLCQGFPEQFKDFVNYTRNLQFEEDPDYTYLNNLLISVLEKDKLTYDFFFDWVKEKPIINDDIAIKRYVLREKLNEKAKQKIEEEKGKDEEDKNSQIMNINKEDESINKTVDIMKNLSIENEEEKPEENEGKKEKEMESKFDGVDKSKCYIF